MYVLKDALKKEEKTEDVSEIVAGIIDHVKDKQDKAIVDLTNKYDGVILDKIKISKEEVERAYDEVSDRIIESLKFAAEQIYFFAQNQYACFKELSCENIEGVVLGHKLVPVNSCASYVPAGRYPLPSSALMSIIPAKVAGVEKIVACSPPNQEYKKIHPMVLVAMDIAGADEIYCMGGAQAIAALAFGTESINPVDLIVGPGNKFVTECKRQISGVVGIDLLAGPSEVLIIADETAPSQYLAMDLLAKCEHDPSSIAILVTTDRSLAEDVQNQVEKELENLETKEVASISWRDKGQIIVADDLDEAIEIANSAASEHLQLQTQNNDLLVERIKNFGSMFIGENSPVAFGDYVSGTNHILPTSKGARFTNGVWVGTFLKVLSYQKVTSKGASNLAGACAHLAGREGLFAHKKSAQLRNN